LNQFIEIEGQQVSLAEIGGVDLDAVAEKRMIRFPIGNFLWEVVAEPEPPKLQKIGDKNAGIPFQLKCINVMGVKDPSDCQDNDPMKLLGQIHRETFFINGADVVGSLGYVVAFLTDIGVPRSRSLPERLTNAVGAQFSAPVTHTKNKDDKDAPPYVNLNRSKIVAKIRAAA